ncbi:hypothetical protein Tco_0245963 [Tanacetum coccineum]
MNRQSPLTGDANDNNNRSNFGPNDLLASSGVFFLAEAYGDILVFSYWECVALSLQCFGPHATQVDVHESGARMVISCKEAFQSGLVE